MKQLERNRQLKVFWVMIMLIGFMCLLPMVSASVDKSFIKDATTSNYGKVTLTDCGFLGTSCLIGSGTKLEEVELKYNTDVCSSDCEAIKNITLYKEGNLIEDVRFINIGSNEPTPISYQFYIQNGSTKNIINDYETKCTKTGEHNDTGEILKCNPILIGTHIEETPIWKGYDGGIMPVGNYIVRLTGHKNPYVSVDWQVKINGIWITDFAEWSQLYLSNSIKDYWNFNEGTGTQAVDSLGVHNLTGLNNSWGTGLISNALTMSYQKINSQVNFNGNSQVTINFWIKKTGAWAEYDSFMCVMPSCDGGAVNNEFRAFSSPVNYVGMNYRDNAGVSGTISGRELSSNIWQMVTFQINQTSIYIWQNASLVASKNVSGMIFNITNNLTIFGTPANYLHNALVDEFGIWNRTLTSGDIIGLYNAGSGLAYNSSTYYPQFTENSQTFNPTTQSGMSENFKINITYNSSYYSGTSVNLVYNNTNYSASSSDTGDTRVYSTNIILIPFTATSTTKTFYWDIGLSNSSGIHNFLSSSNSQTITPLITDNCASNTQMLLNFTMLDEETLLGLNGTIEASLSLYSLGTSNLISSYNTTFNYVTNQSSSICITNSTSNYTMAYTLKYYGNSSLYFKKYKSVQSMTINNQTQQIPLYNLLLASGNTFQAIIVGNLYTGNNNLLVDVQKQYIPTSDFKSVESSITSADGIAIIHLTPNSAVYNFIVSQNGVVIGTFNNYQVECQNIITGQCQITLNLAQATATLPDFSNYGNLSVTFLLDNSTNQLSTTYSSTDGNSHNVNQLVVNNNGNILICNSTSSGTSGTITCTIPAVYTDTTFISRLYSDGTYIGSNQFSLQTEAPNMYGVDIIIEILMFTSLVLLMMSSPILIVIGAMLGILFSVLLIFLASGSMASYITAIIFYIIAGIIIIVQIGKRQ